MKKIIPVLPLRVLMTWLVGSLVVIALVFAITDLRQSHAQLDFSRQMVERNRLADIGLRAMSHLVAERGRSLVLINSPVSSYAKHRSFLAERRREGDAGIADLLARVPARATVKAQAVRQLVAPVKALRQELDREFSLTLAERDPSLPGRWMTAANALIAALLALQEEILTLNEVGDAGFERLNRLRLVAMNFRTQVGAESSMFGISVQSNRVLTREEMAAIYFLRSQSMQLWILLEPGSQKLPDSGHKVALLHVVDALFGQLRPLQDAMLHAAERGELAMEGMALYLKATELTTNATAELVGVLGNEIEAYTRARVAEAEWQQYRSLAMIGGIFLLGALIFFLLARRLTRPLNAIVERVDELIEWQAGYALSVPETRGGDELFRVNQALQLLDETLAARQRSDQELHQQERLSASILAAVPQAVYVADKTGVITLFSPGAEAMLGYAAAEIVGVHSPLLFHDSAELGARAQALSDELKTTVMPDFEAIVARAREYGRPDESEWTFVRKDGSRLSVLLTITVFRSAAGEPCACAVATDITERARTAARMSRFAYHDQLTQLPNRRLFSDRLRVAVAQSRRSGGRMALLLIDLDRFKPVNDNFGHAAGDQLLKLVARRMQQCLRESDTLARLGGDEFVVILPQLGDESAAFRVAEKIRLALEAPFDLPRGVRVSIGCSIGMALLPEHGLDGTSLVQAADRAMYDAKAAGRNCLRMASGVGGEIRARTLPDEPPDIRFVWQYAHRCGESTMDEQHQQLFDRVNNLLHQILDGDGGSARVLPELDALIDELAAHFSYEESILHRYHYPRAEAHAQRHKALLQQAIGLRKSLVAGEPSLGALSVELSGDLLAYVARDMVAEHLIYEDRKFFPFLKEAIRAGQSSETVL